MNSQNKVARYFLSHPKKAKMLFVFLFIVFGMIISLTSYIVFYNYKLITTKNELIASQKEAYYEKKKLLGLKLYNKEKQLTTLKNNDIFKNYINNFKITDEVLSLFKFVIEANKDIYQLRYIDPSGNEKINFTRNRHNSEIYQKKDGELQNKSDREYFIKTKKNSDNNVRYSKLNLNIEYGAIEIPYNPTLRISTPIFKSGIFKGILIENISFEKYIKNFATSALYDISIFDKAGNAVYNKINTNGEIIDNSWSKDLGKKYLIDKYKNYLYENFDESVLKEFIFKDSLNDIIPNTQDLKIIFVPKSIEILQNQVISAKYTLIIFSVIFILSIIIAILFSIVPAELNRILYKTKRILEDKIKVVDSNVLMFVVNSQGIIQDVSTAYSEFTEYDKEELIGKEHYIIKNLIKKINITKQEIQKSNKFEISNVKKNGLQYEARVTIKQDFNNNSDLYTIYVEDLTDQNLIKRMAITDELTKLYNRREFNSTFDRIIAYAQRNKVPFAMIMLDIDYFKQYNDTYGHLEGDKVIKAIANTLLEVSLRSTDMAFRLGGEEFGLIMSAPSLEKARQYAEKIREMVEDLHIKHKKSNVSKYVTISLGLFYRENIIKLSNDDIYQYCDDALYKAKNNGRNQVGIA